MKATSNQMTVQGLSGRQFNSEAACETVRQPMILSELDMQSKACQEQKELLEVLSSKLSPVMSLKPTNPDTNKDCPHSGPAVATRINGNTKSIYSSNNQLQYLIDSLEV